MQTHILKVRITTTEPILGLASANRELQAEFIASKAPKPENGQEEVAAINVAEEIEKTTTVFPSDEKGLFWWDYQMRGAFKGWILQLIELGDCEISKWSYKKAVDCFLFVSPRRIYIQNGSGEIVTKPDGKMQRPLRATTMQGDRIALASSQMINPGAQWDMEVMILCAEQKTKSKVAVLTLDLIRECLNLGSLSGFGQWRGGGFGRFTWEETQ